VNFYLNQLTSAINSEISSVKEPCLYHQGDEIITLVASEPAFKEVSPGLIRIESNVPAIVLNGLTPLGQTPIQLDKNAFVGKQLNVSNGRGGIIKIEIRSSETIYKVDF
jgi:hypothetical protein